MRDIKLQLHQKKKRTRQRVKTVKRQEGHVRNGVFRKIKKKTRCEMSEKYRTVSDGGIVIYDTYTHTLIRRLYNVIYYACTHVT